MATADPSAVLEGLVRAVSAQVNIGFELYNMRRSLLSRSAELPGELARLAAAERILSQAHQDLAALVAQQRQAQS